MSDENTTTTETGALQAAPPDPTGGWVNIDDTPDELSERRLLNAQRLIELVGHNNSAEIIGCSNAYISSIKQTGRSSSRNIGNRSAASIEEGFRLKPGTLSLPHPLSMKKIDPVIFELVAYMTFATRDEIEMVSDLAKLVLRRRFLALLKEKRGEDGGGKYSLEGL